MPAFDLHQHLWPSQLSEVLRLRRQPPFLRGGRLTTLEGSWSVDLDEHALGARLAALDAAGIDTAVVSLQPTLGYDLLDRHERDEIVSAFDEGAAEFQARSGGRLLALAAGCQRPPFTGVCVGASRLLRPALLEETIDSLAPDGGILFVHPDCGRAVKGVPDWWNGVIDYTAQMQAAYFAWIADGASRWPRVRVVFALLAGGAPFQLERLGSRGFETRRLTSLETYFETSSYGRVALELCLATFGVDRLVHGSDLPVIDPAPTMSAILALGKATAHAICDSNPANLLGHDGGLRPRTASERTGPDPARAAFHRTLARA